MGVRYIIIIVTIFFANFAFAQPKSRLAHCLTTAHEVLKENFKNEGKYSDSEEKLKAQLSESCKALPYDITLKADKGFRIVSEYNNETWSVDENHDFVRAARMASRNASGVASNAPNLSAPTPEPKMQRVPIVVATTNNSLKPKSKADPAAPPPPAVMPTATSAPAPTKIAPPKNVAAAVMASDSTPPLVQVPQYIPSVNMIASNIVRKGDDNATKLERCFTKRLFFTKPCTALFSELDAQCGQGGDKVPTLCLELNRHVSTTILDDCTLGGSAAEENYGKCELRARQLKKVCANPLKEFTPECRGLTKFLTKTTNPNQGVAAIAEAAVPVKEVPPTAGVPNALRAPAAIPDVVAPALVETAARATFYTAERTSINAIRNVQTMDSALRKLLKLRPVHFESKETLQKDVGFVAEEVELVDPTYVSYSDKNIIQSIKVPQLTALITGSVQELYGMCRSDSDLQKDLIKRLVTLEGENSELKREVERQTRELIIIKAKLGLK